MRGGRRVRGIRGQVVEPFTGRRSHRFEIEAKVVVLAAGCMATPVATPGALVRRCTPDGYIESSSREFFEQIRDVGNLSRIDDGGKFDLITGDWPSVAGVHFMSSHRAVTR